MNMFTKLLETLGNNFWLIIILCLEVILAVWLLCFARGKKKNRAAEPDGHSVQDVLIALMVIWNVDLKSLFVLPLGGAVTVLLGCIAGDYLGAKKPLPSAFVILRKFRRIDCENRWFCKKSRQIFDDVVYWR